MSQEHTLLKTRSAASYHEAAAAKIIALDSFVDRPGNYVLTKGTFDILHAGHLALFAYCADLASKLEDGGVIAVVESDLSVKKRKGSERPFQGEQTRALQIAHIQSVAGVIICSRDELPNAIAQVSPRFYVKGMDTATSDDSAAAREQVMVSSASNLELAHLPPNGEMVVFTDDGTLSTSALVKRIRATCKYDER